MKPLSGLASYFSQKFLSCSSSQAEVEVVEAKDVDMDEDCAPLVDKGKEISASSSGTKLPEKNYATGSSHVIGSGSGMFHGEDEYNDHYDFMELYFDALNIPTGVEADVPIPLDDASGAADDLSYEHGNQYAVLQSYFDDLDIRTGVDFEIPILNSSSTSVLSESENAKQKSAAGSNLGYHDQYAILQSYFDDLDIPTGVEFQIPFLNSTMPSASIHRSSGFHESSQKPWGSQNMVGSSSQKQFLNVHEITKHAGADKGLHVRTRLKNPHSGAGSSDRRDESHDEILKKFDLFKRFDTVQDYSDHYYGKNGSSMKQPSKGWAKKIQEEWRILENDLPEAIYIRVYESRMDLLRAVIIGAEGTPYHDGLFFFDVFFPDNYPSVPPMVHYHSHGLRINPNLYNGGKVCLSLLNTWVGGKKEMWNPRLSTILQVLVSIQGLVLNAKPYFNEPGYEALSGKPSGETNSLLYNEDTFISSLKTMVYTIRKPPRYFEDFVAGHFRKHAHDILAACKAYSNGAQVGSLIKGAAPNVHGDGKSCSKKFKHNLAGYMKTVADAFAQVGHKDC